MAASCGRDWDHKSHFTPGSETTEGLIMNSSQRGLQDGVDRFGSHVNTLSQDKSGCWRGEGGGEDEEEERCSEPEVSSLSLHSACDRALCPSLYWKYSPEPSPSTEE